MKTYRPQPGGPIHIMLAVLAQQPRPIASTDLALTCDEDPRDLEPMMRAAIRHGLVQVTKLKAIDKSGHLRPIKHFEALPALHDMLAELGPPANGLRCPRPGPRAIDWHWPALADVWLLASAATTPRIPLPGFRVVSDFLNTGRLAA